jgi:hypothetical protein
MLGQGLGYKPHRQSTTIISPLDEYKEEYHHTATFGFDAVIDSIYWNWASGGSSTFLDLSDTPNSYSGASGCVVAVNGAEDGLEFVAGGSGDNYWYRCQTEHYLRPLDDESSGVLPYDVRICGNDCDCYAMLQFHSEGCICNDIYIYPRACDWHTLTFYNYYVSWTGNCEKHVDWWLDSCSCCVGDGCVLTYCYMDNTWKGMPSGSGLWSKDSCDYNLSIYPTPTGCDETPSVCIRHNCGDAVLEWYSLSTYACTTLYQEACTGIYHTNDGCYGGTSVCSDVCIDFWGRCYQYTWGDCNRQDGDVLTWYCMDNTWRPAPAGAVGSLWCADDTCPIDRKLYPAPSANDSYPSVCISQCCSEACLEFYNTTYCCYTRIGQDVNSCRGWFWAQDCCYYMTCTDDCVNIDFWAREDICYAGDNPRQDGDVLTYDACCDVWRPASPGSINWWTAQVHCFSSTCDTGVTAGQDTVYCMPAIYWGYYCSTDMYTYGFCQYMPSCSCFDFQWWCDCDTTPRFLRLDKSWNCGCGGIQIFDCVPFEDGCNKSIDMYARQMFDCNGCQSIEYNCRYLNDASAGYCFFWDGCGVTHDHTNYYMFCCGIGAFSNTATLDTTNWLGIYINGSFYRIALICDL